MVESGWRFAIALVGFFAPLCCCIAQEDSAIDNAEIAANQRTSDETIVSAFKVAHNGWSVDELLIQDSLRIRLSKHLDQSDRKSLFEYLRANSQDEITLELHIFAADSPANDTAAREAYESDLIRTRQPRFNIAP